MFISRAHRVATTGLCCLAFLSLPSFSSADVEFTAPAAGALVPVGTINVAWKDSGLSPALQDLTQYTLDLMVGGNAAGDMQSLTTFVSQGFYSADGQNTATGTIQAGIAQEVENGFFFRMTSTVQTGGTVENFSSRFSIANLTGVTSAQYRAAAEALNGSTDGPGRIGNGVVVSSAASSTATAISTTSSTLTTATATPPTDSLPPTSTPTTTSDSLTAGARIGIILAIAAFFVLLSAVGLFFLIRWRRRKQSGIIPLGTNPFLDDKAELSAYPSELKPRSSHSDLSAQSNLSEMDAVSTVYEMDDGARRPELDHMAVRAELPG